MLVKHGRLVLVTRTAYASVVPADDAPASPLLHALTDLHRRFSSLSDGNVADYIPELQRAVPEHFGLCIATVDGHTYAVGDSNVSFTIQSISKPFVYGLALSDQGIDHVTEYVSVEPSGEAFNAISLDVETGRPRNPMINAGAIATAGLVDGSSSAVKDARVMDFLSKFAGNGLGFDAGVYQSEKATGHRNRSIAYMLRNAEILGDDVEDVLNRYFRQCSVLVNVRDLAMMAATLAKGGENPRTGERVMEENDVAQVLSVMATCGMYDYAGSWLYKVGMPAKSGVSGGIIAVLPGQLGVGVYSPRLDAVGNSVRGVAVCEALSQEFGLHLLRPPVSMTSAVMNTYTLADVSSKRRRSEVEMRQLVGNGSAVAVLRLQGPLAMSNTEAVLRTALEVSTDARFIVFDCHRVQTCDLGAARLFERFVALEGDRGVQVVFAGLRENDSGGMLLWSAAASDSGSRCISSIDLALEWCEDQLLAADGPRVGDAAELALSEHPMLVGLSQQDRESVERASTRVTVASGERVLTQGDAAESAFLLMAGSVSVNLTVEYGERYRIATMGPGAVFGEMALMDAEPRTADIDAETDVVCYEIRVAELDGAAQSALLGWLARQLAARLRRADREIASLAS